LPVVNESVETLRRTDFEPFKALADLPMAMTAHVLYPALDKTNMATVSPAIIKLIRDEIGFKGLLMSDDLSMEAMQGDYTQRARAALDAGCDVVLHCNVKMEEMRGVAKGVGPLAGEPLKRAERAMQALKTAPLDMEQARLERDSLLGVSAWTG